MDDSVLNSIKKKVGVPEGTTDFDDDIIIDINTAFVELSQIGVKQLYKRAISSQLDTWRMFGLGSILGMVQQYTYIKVKLIFDPPASSIVKDSLQNQLAEVEWRIRESCEVIDEEEEYAKVKDIYPIVDEYVTEHKEELKGDPGEPGPKGKPGPKGESGYSPQKGIDYFTEEDIEEFENTVIEELKPQLDAKMDSVNPIASGKFVMNQNEEVDYDDLGEESFSEGHGSSATGNYSHAEGYQSTASGDIAHAEGYRTTASGLYAHAEGNLTEATGSDSHAEGYYTHATASSSHAEGNDTNAIASCAHAEGWSTHAEGVNSHAEGKSSRALSANSHAEGDQSQTHADAAHSEGYWTHTWGKYSHSEGENTSTASTAQGSHTEGYRSITVGKYSHAEGYNTQTGLTETAEKDTSQHSEGVWTAARGHGTHAEGGYTKANGKYSHAEGYYTIATREGSHVEGVANIEDLEGKYLHIVGNGTVNEQYGFQTRSNAYTLDSKGNGEFAGDVKANACGGSKPVSLAELGDLINYAGYTLGLSIDTKTYVMTLQLKDRFGQPIDTKTIDFPIESMVVNGTCEDGILKLTLQNGNTIDVDVSSLVGGLVKDSLTIAGIDLKDDISSEELVAALNIDVDIKSKLRSVFTFDSHDNVTNIDLGDDFFVGESTGNVVTGIDNQLNNASGVMVTGQNNQIKMGANGSIIGGAGNEVNKASIVYGSGLKTSKNYQAIFGKGNEAKENSILEIGNGVYDPDEETYTRKNAFSVDSNGDAHVANDLYIKGESISDKLNKISKIDKIDELEIEVNKKLESQPAMDFSEVEDPEWMKNMSTVQEDISRLSESIVDFKNSNLEQGINLLNPLDLKEETISGITFTPVFNNGYLEYILVSGTATGTARYTLVENIPMGTYFVNGIVGGSSTTYQLAFRRNSDAMKNIYNGYEQINAASVTYNYNIIVVVRKGVTLDGLKIYPMMWVGVDENLQYEPYGLKRLQPQINAIKSSMHGNSPFFVPLGVPTLNSSTNTYTSESVKRTSDYVSKIMVMNYLGISNDGIVSVTNNEYDEDTISELIRSGLADSIKFHCNPKLSEAVSLYGDSCIDSYFAVVKEQVNKYRGYGMPISNIFIFNEDSIYGYSDHTKIISKMNELKNDTSCNVGISYAGFSGLWSVNGNIFNACDIVGINIYPRNGFLGDVSISAAVDAFNREYDRCQYWLYRGKKVWITEFGVCPNMEAINSPESGMEGTDGKAQSLFLEGLYRSKFKSKIERAYFWYRNVTTYAKDTLLSLKNGGEIR